MGSMNSKTVIRQVAILLLAACVVVALPVWGRANAGYELSRQTISARAESSGGEYELVVKVGAADMVKMSGGEYEMVVSLELSPPLGDVTLKTFADFAVQWLGTEGSFTADLDGDNDVDLADLSMFLEQWLAGYPSDWHL